MTEPTPSAAPVLCEISGATLRITLNRPRALNAMTMEMTLEIGAALDAAEADRDVRVILFTGTGRAFCVGADLTAARGRTAGANGAADFIAAYNALLNRIEAFPKPVVVALNGMTLGAGLELALVSDIAVASTAARIGDGHAKFGLLPGGGASARLPRRIGPAAAKWLFFTGDFQDNADLQRWGLLQAVYPEDGFEAAVAELCGRIAARSPLGLARMKALADAAPNRSLAEALAAEQAALQEHMTSKDRAEGLAAFAGKRRPVFTGE